MKQHVLWSAAVAATMTLACSGGSDGPPDGAPAADADRVDAASGDAGAEPDTGADVGPGDAGGEDGSTVSDAGSPDAGLDAGVELDSGLADAGVRDAGARDAGGDDSGPSDAGGGRRGPTRGAPVRWRKLAGRARSVDDARAGLPRRRRQRSRLRLCHRLGGHRVLGSERHGRLLGQPGGHRGLLRAGAANDRGGHGLSPERGRRRAGPAGRHRHPERGAPPRVALGIRG